MVDRERKVEDLWRKSGEDVGDRIVAARAWSN